MRYCAECTYMLLGREHEYNNDGRFWCESKGEYRAANSAECEYFCKAYGRSYKLAQSYIEYSQEKQSINGCYITTVVCEILNFKDDNSVLNTLRNFRNNTLQKDEKYKEILLAYDVIGPTIATHLQNDDNRTLLAQNLFTNWLIGIAEYIDQKETVNAIKAYQNMTTWLMKRYEIEDSYSEEQLQQVDWKQAGHGHYVKKRLEPIR